MVQKQTGRFGQTPREKFWNLQLSHRCTDRETQIGREGGIERATATEREREGETETEAATDSGTDAETHLGFS